MTTITKTQLKTLIKEAIVQEQRAKMTEQELMQVQKDLFKQIKSSLLAFRKNQRYNQKLKSEKLNEIYYQYIFAIKDIYDVMINEADDLRDIIDANTGNYGGF